jgi:hypothetical protein
MRHGVGGDGDDDPSTGTKAAVQLDFAAMRVVSELTPRLAHGLEAQVLGPTARIWLRRGLSSAGVVTDGQMGPPGLSPALV